MSNVKRWEEGEQWIDVDLNLCEGAGDCALVCPSDAYQVGEGTLEIVYIGDCSGCSACLGSCPHDAILNHWAWE